LPDFDPSTDKEVHPEHRVSIIMKMDLKRKRVTRLSISSTSSSRYRGGDSDASPESEAVSDGEFDDASSAYDSAPPSRTTRSKLLSPRKTRSRKVIPVDDDEEAGPSRNVRRSTRSSNGLRISLDEDIYNDPSPFEEDSDYQVDTNRKSKSAKNTRREAKAAPPAYGQFRAVEDVLAHDEDPLLAHRRICEKCLEPPSHKQLVLLRKRLKKGKRKARGSDDDGSTDEEERVLNRGGWVRW